MATETQTDTSAPVAAPVETKAAETAVVAPAETKASEAKSNNAQDIARLVRREKQIQDQARQVKAQLDEVAKYRQEQAQREAQIRSAKQNPLKAIEAMGISLDDFKNFMATGKPSPDLERKALQDQIEELKAQQSQFTKDREQEAERSRVSAEQQAEQAYLGQAHKFVQDNPDAYELTNSRKAYNLIDYVIEEAAKTQGRLLTAKEAADAVEAHLEDEFDSIHKAYTATKKYKSKVAPAPKAEEKQEENAAAKRAISNDMSATGLTVKPVEKVSKSNGLRYDSVASLDEIIAKHSPPKK